jgi:mannosyltransferase
MPAAAERVGAPALRSRWTHALSLAVLVVVGAAARLPTIGDRSLWGDEAYTIAIAQRGVGGMFSLFTRESNGLLYYALVYPVSHLDPPVGVLRAPSVAFGLLAILAIHWTGALLLNRRTGLIAAALFAVSPLAVHYAQEARFYSLVTLLAVLSFGCLARAARDGRWWWAAYIATTAALSYSSALGTLLMLLPQAIFVTGLRRPGLVRAWALAMAGVGVLLIPLAVLSTLVLRTRDPLYFVAKPAPGEIVQMLGTMFGGKPILAVTVVLAAGLVVRRLRGGWRPPARDVLAHPVTVVAAWAVLPVLVTFALSWLAHPLFIARYMICAVPGACLLIAALIDRAPRRVGAGALIAVLALSVAQIVREARGEREDMRSAIRALAGERRAGEPVVFDTASGLATAGHYDARLAGARGRLVVSEWRDAAMPAGVSVLDDPGGYHRAPTGPPSAALLRGLARGAGRVWVVFSEVGTTQGDVLRGGGVGWARAHCAVSVRRFPGVDLVSVSRCDTAS